MAYSVRICQSGTAHTWRLRDTQALEGISRAPDLRESRVTAPDLRESRVDLHPTKTECAHGHLELKLGVGLGRGNGYFSFLLFCSCYLKVITPIGLFRCPFKSGWCHLAMWRLWRNVTYATSRCTSKKRQLRVMLCVDAKQIVYSRFHAPLGKLNNSPNPTLTI